jgi:hypothetical protein
VAAQNFFARGASRLPGVHSSSRNRNDFKTLKKKNGGKYNMLVELILG